VRLNLKEETRHGGSHHGIRRLKQNYNPNQPQTKERAYLKSKLKKKWGLKW
jgi:hypothetical protein